MLDANPAIQRAKQHATELLRDEPYSDMMLEEVELYNPPTGRTKWRITLGWNRPKSMPREKNAFTKPDPLFFDIENRVYRVFELDADDGALLSMKMREEA